MHARLSARLSSILLLFVLGLCAIPPGIAQTLTLPDFGDYSQQYISLDTEQQLGLEVLKRIRDRGLIIEDVQLNEYLASVGQRIATYANQTGQSYTFFWMDASTINAFAAPGAFIGIHSGLLLATRNENELAGVIAHEIAHVSQRHIARAIADAKRLALPMAAALVAAAVLASATEGDAGQAAMVGAMAANAQHQINFTRAHEQEADRIGVQMLSQAGFDPEGMADFFARLERLAGSSVGKLPDYLLTHPRPTNRAADTLNRQDIVSSRSRFPRDTSAYYLAKSRMRVLTTRNTGALIRYFESTLETKAYEHENAERYGYALALKRAGRYDEAQRQIERLRQNDPDRLAYRIEEAEIALAKGNRDRAWRLFEETRRLYSDDFSLAMHFGHALATQGDPRLAMQVLQPYLRRRVNDASVFGLYAQAAQRAGDTVATHATLAEYYYLNNQMDAAIEQAELGLKHPQATPYEQAQLRARLKQLKALKAEQDQ